MGRVGRRGALALLLAAGGAGEAGAAQAGERRILVFGDSQAQGLAAALLRVFRSDRATRVLDRSKIGTGLSRPAFDWVAQAKALAEGERAGVAVAMFGANDRVPGQGEAREERVQRFTEEYGTKVAEVARPFRAAGIPLVWAGHPVVRDEAFAEDIALVNDIVADDAVPEGAVYVSTWEMFRGADGAFAAYGPGVDGQTARLRADDGVHLTPAGYDVLAGAVLPEIERMLRGRSRQ